jgi:hypothetical protein
MTSEKKHGVFCFAFTTIGMSTNSWFLTATSCSRFPSLTEDLSYGRRTLVFPRNFLHLLKASGLWVFHLVYGTCTLQRGKWHFPRRSHRFPNPSLVITSRELVHLVALGAGGLGKRSAGLVGSDIERGYMGQAEGTGEVRWVREEEEHCAPLQSKFDGRRCESAGHGFRFHPAWRETRSQLIVMVSAFDPGEAGFVATSDAEPALATSLAGIATVTCVASTIVVVR